MGQCVLHYLVPLSSEYQPCEETGATRLTDITGSGDNDTMIIGRLEICVDGYWGSVCAYFVNNATASVVCRQIGHATEGKVCMDVVHDIFCNEVTIVCARLTRGIHWVYLFSHQYV